mgnify:CR=1 FL=1
MCKTNSNIDRPMTEADVKRIVAAAVKASKPTAGGGGDTEAKRKLKERKKRGRLPEGKRCKAGRPLAHDEYNLQWREGRGGMGEEWVGGRRWDGRGGS